MTITREQIRELAEFQDAKSCAVSFYFQPSTPRNKAHKEDTILIKDLAREALRTLESKLDGKEKKDSARTISTASCACRANCAATEPTARLCLPARRKTSGANTKCPPAFPVRSSSSTGISI